MNWSRFFKASLMLIFGSFSAGVFHYFAHSQMDFRLTILAYGIAVASGMYYGIECGYDIGGE